MNGFKEGQEVYFIDSEDYKVITSKIIGFMIVNNIKFALFKGWIQQVKLDELFTDKTKAENKIAELFVKNNPNMNEKSTGICRGTLPKTECCLCYDCTSKCIEGCKTCHSMNGKYKSTDKYICRAKVS